jgi:hypothetical protein
MGWWPEEFNYLFDNLSEEEAAELAQELFVPGRAVGTTLLPPEEDYFVPVLYADCKQEAYQIGYPDNDPKRTRVFRLDRDLYSEDSAKKRFEVLQERNGWRLLERPFYTAKWWCWKIEETNV